MIIIISLKQVRRLASNAPTEQITFVAFVFLNQK